MNADLLKTRPIERIEMNMAHALGPECRLVVWGIRAAGADDCVIALQIGDIVLEPRGHDPVTGAPPESPEILRLRAMAEVVSSLPPGAPRDTKGSAIGYFVYRGLPADHCKKAALSHDAKS
jgi:hypothetical protein